MSIERAPQHPARTVCVWLTKEYTQARVPICADFPQHRAFCLRDENTSLDCFALSGPAQRQRHTDPSKRVQTLRTSLLGPGPPTNRSAFRRFIEHAPSAQPSHASQNTPTKRPSFQTFPCIPRLADQAPSHPSLHRLPNRPSLVLSCKGRLGSLGRDLLNPDSAGIVDYRT